MQKCLTRNTANREVGHCLLGDKWLGTVHLLTHGRATQCLSSATQRICSSSVPGQSMWAFSCAKWHDVRFFSEYIGFGGTRWHSWLRHCATSRKVAGSIPDGVIRIFHWHNPSGRTMVLGLAQPLIEMSTRNIWAASVVWWLACWPLKPGRSRRIFRAKKSSARLPSEGK
jgi:hypothetical protein